MDCKHGLNEQWCAICRGEIAARSNGERQGYQEIVLLEATRPKLTDILIFWHADAGEQVTGLDPGADVVHLIGSTSIGKLRRLMKQCPNLRVIEGTPSQQWYFSQYLDEFAQAGIGVSLAVRGPKSREKQESKTYRQPPAWSEP